MKTPLLILTLATVPLFAADPVKPGPQAAKVEPVVSGALRMEVRPEPQDRNPARHRTSRVYVENLTAFNEDLEFTTYQMMGETVTQTKKTSFSRFPSKYRTYFSVEMDVAPENGWVFMVRRKSGELLGIKASAPRFEALARRTGSFQGPPAAGN